MLLQAHWSLLDYHARPYLWTSYFLVLLDQAGQSVPGVWTFDPEGAVARKQDGTVVKISSFEWRCPDLEIYQKVLQLLPQDLYPRVRIAAIGTAATLSGYGS
jgi:hypothetical protein